MEIYFYTLQISEKLPDQAVTSIAYPTTSLTKERILLVNEENEVQNIID